MHSLRILAVTDFHGDAEAFLKTALKARESHVNVVVVCGDITHFGALQQARKLLSFLIDLRLPVLFVPGNCDPPVLAEVKMEMIESIHGKCKQVDNINFLGLGGSSPSPFGTPFELSETVIADILGDGFRSCQVDGGIVLVSHDPPRDTVVDVTFTGDHVGSISLREFIERTKPRLVLCGHIHEAIGVDKIGDSVVVNPGPARHGKCVLVDLNIMVDVKIDSL